MAGPSAHRMLMSAITKSPVLMMGPVPIPVWTRTSAAVLLGTLVPTVSRKLMSALLILAKMELLVM